MSFTRILGLCGLLTVVSVMASFAQERAAASALGTQMTWSALADQVKAASNRVTVLDGQMQKTIICNKRFMAYAPGAAGADGDGCIENQLIKQLASRMDKAEKDIVDTNAKLTKLDARVTTEIARIDGNVAKVVADVKELTKRVTTAEADITKLEGRMTTLEASVKTLTTKVTTLEKDMDAVQDTVKTHTAQIKDINADIVAINKDITALEKSVASLTTKVKDNTDDIRAIANCGANGMVWNGSKCVTSVSVATEWKAMGLAKYENYRNKFIGEVPARPANFSLTNLFQTPFDTIKDCPETAPGLGYVMRGESCPVAGAVCKMASQVRNGTFENNDNARDSLAWTVSFLKCK